MARDCVIHSANEIKKIRKATEFTAYVRDNLALAAHAGMSTKQLDVIAGELIRSTGGKSAFLGYHGFPGNVCISVNEEVIHGIGNDYKILQNGDIVSVDVGVSFEGGMGDSALTFPIGEISDDAKRLLKGTQESLYAGIAAARTGRYIRDISAAIEKVAKHYNLSIVRNYVGHGVGTNLHEPPEIPNYTTTFRGPKLQAGMVLAIEPMFNLGTSRVVVDPNDHWTVRTYDGQYSAHFEHSILITNNEPEILTCQKMMQ